MLDVIPPNGPSYGTGTGETPQRSRRVERGQGSPQHSAPQLSSRSVPVGPRVVKLDWQLPARLRRPVRQELTRQRKLKRKRQRQQQQAGVQFERRQIRTEAPLDSRQTQAEPTNRGVEHHTGDVYLTSRPGAQVTLPPYAGGFVRQALTDGAATPKPGPRPTSPQRRAAAPQQRPVRAPNIQKRALPADAAALLGGERDIPFDWQTGGSLEEMPEYDERPRVEIVDTEPLGSGIIEPRRRFALPLHFSVFPGRSRKPHVATSKAASRLRSAHLRDRHGYGEVVPVAAVVSKKKRRASTPLVSPDLP